MIHLQSLPVIPIAYEDETAGSFVIRLSELNHYENPLSLCKAKMKVPYVESLVSIINQREKFKKFLSIFGLDLKLESLCYSRKNSTHRSARYLDSKKFWSDTLFNKDGFKYCPLCLNEKAYWRKKWLLIPYYVCHIHHTYIYTLCCSCKKTLDINRKNLCICPNCSFDLRRTPVYRVKESKYIDWLNQFIETAEQSQIDIFNLFFPAYVDLNMLHNGSVTIEKAVETSYLFFNNNILCIEEIAKQINLNVHKGRPFGQTMIFHGNNQQLNLFARSVYLTSLNLERLPKNFSYQFLSIEEAAIKYNLNTSKIYGWLKAGLIYSYQIEYQNNQIKESLRNDQIELLIAQLRLEPELEKIKIERNKLNQQRLWKIADVAKHLQVHSENIRHLLKTPFLKPSVNKTLNNQSYTVVCNEELDIFTKKYVLVGTLAKELKVNVTNLAEKLASIGIRPISGPHIDGERNNIYLRDSICQVSTHTIREINGYPTRTGAKPLNQQSIDKKMLQNINYISLKEAGNMLKIHHQKVTNLVKNNILIKDTNNKSRTLISLESICSLLEELNDDEYVPLNDALIDINCSANWFDTYWVNTGYAKVKNLIYWKFVKKSEIDAIKKFKRKFFFGAEACKIMGVHHSFITNLEKQGLIDSITFNYGAFNNLKVYQQKEVYKLIMAGHGARLRQE